MYEQSTIGKRIFLRKNFSIHKEKVVLLTNFFTLKLLLNLSRLNSF